MLKVTKVFFFPLPKFVSPNNYLRYNNLIGPIAYDSKSISEIKCACHGSPSNPPIALSHHGSKFPIIDLSILQHKIFIKNKQLSN